MGIKRPLVEEDFPELSFKQPKQFDDNIKLTFMTEDIPSRGTYPRVDSPGEAKGNFCKLHFDGMLENGDADGSSMADKEFEGSAPLSLVTNSSSEEVGNEDTSFLHHFPEYIDFSRPWRFPGHFEDPYVSSLNGSLRKEVPVGPDYQANLPQWDAHSNGKDLLGSNYFLGNDTDQRLMGTCIIPMPRLNDSNIHEATVGRGRTDCSCLDMGSMRCVQQHVKEAREKLRETIGEENFTKLGFYDMGEEVASKWTPEDEHIFHEVVFSNPASRGTDFWEHLSAAFPTRTKREIVSYYFNVFMLRRRAMQNRSYLLQIDSDDDEEQKDAHGGGYSQSKSSLLNQDTDNDDGEDNNLKPIYGEYYVFGGEDEDSTIESFGDEDLDAGWVDDYGSDPENVCADEGSDNNNGNFAGGVCKQEVKESKEHDDCSFDSEFVQK
ncbi:hypothetical protein CDL12_15930 [Handroanthus impetiginosus]|uniref:Uncharacterized protein n=1 Tax=Handroanthus impetiginosus TaxID=429701 RepID=A0A2G9H1Q8_9LAMI|nr:hypothetical protein CDL12_15930 [Handroanthus impetiginosus]